MQVFSGIDQAVEGALVLRFGNGCSVEVNVCSKECCPCWLVHRLYGRDLESFGGSFCEHICDDS